MTTTTAATVPGMTLAQMAQELYEDQQGVNPAWNDLGDVTQEVWLEKAYDGVVPEGWQPLIKIPRNNEGQRI